MGGPKASCRQTKDGSLINTNLPPKDIAAAAAAADDDDQMMCRNLTEHDAAASECWGGRSQPRHISDCIQQSIGCTNNLSQPASAIQ
jgi:hypothetical protein